MSYPVWGISKWRDFEQCPAMYYAKHISKEWKEAPNDAMERGSAVHKRFEEAVNYELQLPEELARFQPFVDGCVQLKAQGASVVPEFKMGMRIDFTRCDYFRDEKLRIRAAFDLYVEQKRSVMLVDYKTGKFKPSHKEDAEFYSAVGHMTTGALKTEMTYLYVDEPQNSFKFECVDAPLVMANWWKKFDYADKIIASGNVPANSCNACAWCGAFKCPKNRNKKLGNG